VNRPKPKPADLSEIRLGLSAEAPEPQQFSNLAESSPEFAHDIESEVCIMF